MQVVTHKVNGAYQNAEGTVYTVKDMKNGTIFKAVAPGFDLQVADCAAHWRGMDEAQKSALVIAIF